MHRTMLLTAAVAALGAAAPAAEAALPGENGPILYGAYREAGGLFMSLPLGGTPAALFATDDYADHVDVSPDGKRVVYLSANKIWVADRDGGGARQISPGDAMDGEPSWSPDGRTIIFSTITAESDGRWELWTMRPDGTDRTRLGDGVRGEQPVYSPDGSRIAFVEQSEPRAAGYSAIYVADVDGGDAELVAAGSAPDWTPDGRSLVYVDDDPGDYDVLQRIEVEGESGPEDVTDPGDWTDYRNPSVSPDGTRVVAEYRNRELVRGVVGQYGLATMRIDGSGLERVDGTGDALAPKWTRLAGRTRPAGGESTPQQPQQQPAAPQAPQPVAGGAASTKAPRTCGSRRVFWINVRGKRLRRVSVVVNGKKTAVTRDGSTFRARVDLRRLPKGRFTVRIRKTLKGGKVRTETRRYRTCVPKR